MDKDQLSQLSEFVSLLKQQPNLIHAPELLFFKDFLLSLGATLVPEPEIPAPAEETIPSAPKDSDFFDSKDTDRWTEESEPLPSLSPARELTDAEQDKVNDLKSSAADASSTDEAIKFMNQVISLGGATAMTLTKRADLLLKSKRPLAAIADCDAALKLNPDSAKAFRIRGTANRHLQRWESAHFDLANAQTIDYDDKTEQIKKYVDEKYKAVALAKREYKEKYETTKKKQPAPTATARPSPMPNMGGMPGMPNMADLFSDPDLAAAFTNPRIMAALQGMMTNPASILQYQNDPEIGPILGKLMSKMGGGMM